MVSAIEGGGGMRDLIDRLWLRVYIGALEVAAYAIGKVSGDRRAEFGERVRDRLARARRERDGEDVVVDDARWHRD